MKSYPGRPRGIAAIRCERCGHVDGYSHAELNACGVELRNTEGPVSPRGALRCNGCGNYSCVQIPLDLVEYFGMKGEMFDLQERTSRTVLDMRDQLEACKQRIAEREAKVRGETSAPLVPVMRERGRFDSCPVCGTFGGLESSHGCVKCGGSGLVG
jgi:hypothetical protein